ncbi:MAG: MFS transporter [Microthrixaceae bacterium]
MTNRRAAGPWLVTWSVLTGAFAIGLNFTILTVSRPSIAEDLNTSVASLVWLVSGPIVANALVAATGGKLGDILGHRRVYLASFAGMTVFTVLCAFAWSPASLITFRIVSAMLGAAISPCAMAIINLMFAPHERAKALGYWALVGAGSPMIGLVIGGPLVEAFGWRSIFVIQIPVLVGALAVCWRVLPHTERGERTRFDVAGNVALAAAVLALMLLAERTPKWGWSDARTIGIAVAAVAFARAFVVIERRVEHPLIPIRYFRRRSFTSSVIAATFAQFGYMGGFILLPVLLDEVGNWSDTRVSLTSTPRPFAFAIAGMVAGRLFATVEPRTLTLVGTSMISVSLVMIAFAVDGLPLWLIVASALVSGWGMGTVQPVSSTVVANSVSNQDLGVAGATVQMAIQVATSLGMNIFDAMHTALGATNGTLGGFERSYQIGALISAGGIAAALWIPRRAHLAHDPIGH